MPKFSCITTTYNEGPALMRSVQSILSQTYQDFEYFIVDDGSCQQDRDLLASLTDPRITVIFQANAGVSGARNRALAQVTGDYVCFLDADDTRPNWALETFAKHIERDDPDLIFCRSALSDIRNNIFPFYDTPIFDELENRIPDALVTRDDEIQHSIWPLAQLLEPQTANKVVRRSLLSENGIRFPDTHFFEDSFFHTSVLAAAKRLSFVQTPCFAYFTHYGRPQITSGHSERRFDIIAVTKLTLEWFASRPQFQDPLYRACVFCACTKMLEWCENSVSHMWRAQFGEAVKALIRLIDPLYLHLPDDVFAKLGINPAGYNYAKALADGR